MRSIDQGLRALFAVQAALPRAILAGGYLRDCLLGREPKDIDIFVPHEPGVEDGRFECIRADGTGFVATPMMGAAEYMERTEVSGIWDVRGFDLPVQIVMLEPGLDPVERAELHDFGICQVWHDGAELHTTDSFEMDKAMQTFTLCHCEDEREYKRSMRRWERLRVKYPSFTLVVPERFREFVEALG